MQGIVTSVAVMDERISAAFKRIDEERSRTVTLQKTVTALEVLTMEVKRIGEELSTQGKAIDTLRMKPAMRWESVLGQVITLLVAAGVGFFFSVM